MGVHAVMSADMRVADQSLDGKLPPGISSVLGVLLSSAVVLDSDDRVLSSSAAAREFGLVEGDKLVVGELLALARQVRREGPGGRLCPEKAKLTSGRAVPRAGPRAPRPGSPPPPPPPERAPSSCSP